MGGFQAPMAFFVSVHFLAELIQKGYGKIHGPFFMHNNLSYSKGCHFYSNLPIGRKK